MIADQRQHTPLTRRKAIDRLLQLREKSTGRKRKSIRKWIAKLAGDQMRVLNVPVTSEKDRRRANIQRRETRHKRISQQRAAVAAFRESKPVFE